MKASIPYKIFEPLDHLPKNYTGAAYPTGRVKSDNDIQIFFSSRNAQNKSHIFYADFSFVEGTFHFKCMNELPIMKPGVKGLFDSDGVSMGCLVQEKNQLNLFYLGWHLQKEVPWMNTVGLAFSLDGGKHFQKNARVPFFDRSEEDPFSISYPWIIKEHGLYYMFYGSNLIWGAHKDDMDHVIKLAKSIDGKNWDRSHDAIFKLTKTAIAFSRPTVVRHKNIFLMMYSVKNFEGIYNIGMATSANLHDWKTIEVNIQPSGEWDNEQMCYPSFINIGDELHVLYNGNGYGKTGFGCFKLEGL